MAHQRLASRVSLHPHPELETAMLSVKQIELKGGPPISPGLLIRPGRRGALQLNPTVTLAARPSGSISR